MKLRIVLTLIIMALILVGCGKKDVFSYAKRGDIKAIEKLIESNQDLIGARNHADSNLLHVSANEGNLALTKLLIKHGVRGDCLNKYGVAPIHVAAEKGHEEIVVLLIENGIGVNYETQNGLTPLDFAFSRERIKLAKRLYSMGGKSNYYQCHYVARIGSVKDMASLLKKGNELTTQDDYGRCPIHYAAMRKGADMIKFLIEQGASYSVKDSTGRTAMHYAASAGSLEIIRLLKEKGAQHLITDDNGKSPLDYAKEKRRTEVYEILAKSKDEL